MGGAPLTVAWRGISTDPESARCWEAAATDPALDDVRITPIPGYGSYRSNAASAGTDSGGGHVDIDLVGLTREQCRRVETTFRRYGNAAWWRPARRADGTRYGWQEHLHVLRTDCADLAAPARTQLTDYRLGWSGLPIGGRTLRDSGSRAYIAARWATVKASLLLSKPTPTPVPEEDIMASIADLEAALRRVLPEVVRAVVREELDKEATARSIMTGYNIVLDTRAGDPAPGAPRVAPSALLEAAAKPGRLAVTVKTDRKS